MDRHERSLPDLVEHGRDLEHAGDEVNRDFANVEPGEVAAIGGVGAIMVDTSAAFFEGDAENDNPQIGDHARMLRRLIELPGGPVVIVGCHPAKYATSENMLPRGGGAFIAELDGNLTAIKKDNIAQVHWFYKLRGLDFEPISFEIMPVTCDRLKDTKGQDFWTAIARAIGSVRQAEIEDKARSDEDQVLLVLDQSPHFTQAKIAEALGWRGKTGEPLLCWWIRSLTCVALIGLSWPYMEALYDRNTR
jgi:hypothetical protein